MGDLRKIFQKRMGKPSPKAKPMDVSCDGGAEFTMEMYLEEVGAGWFLDRFIYLFGDRVSELEPALHAWEFLTGKLPNARVLGQTATGALVFTPNLLKMRVAILDPWRVAYIASSQYDLGGLLGWVLPDAHWPELVDTDLYREFRKATRMRVEVGEMLAPKVALPLGGTATLDNVQLLPLVEYYAATAVPYARVAQAKTKKSSRSRSAG
jgi:hypothetical protein